MTDEEFTHAVEQYQHRLIGAVRKRLRLSSADAEDAVQEALMKCWKHRRQFRGKSMLTTWLTTAAVNEGLQVIRREKSQRSKAARAPQASGTTQATQEAAAELWRLWPLLPEEVKQRVLQHPLKITALRANSVGV